MGFFALPSDGCGSVLGDGEVFRGVGDISEPDGFCLLLTAIAAYDRERTVDHEFAWCIHDPYVLSPAAAIVSGAVPITSPPST